MHQLDKILLPVTPLMLDNRNKISDRNVFNRQEKKSKCYAKNLLKRDS